MRTILTLLALFLMQDKLVASGWHDFRLDIGDGYYIFCCNFLDIGVGKKNGPSLISPRNQDAVGPVVRYFTNDKLILTRNLGKKSRNLFEGDTFEDIDPSQEYYFILYKSDDRVVGPLSRADFESHPDVVRIGVIGWKTPRNPDRWKPLMGDLMFVAISIPILAIKLYWISIPLLIAMIFWIRHIIRKRRKKKSHADPVV